MYRTSSCAFVQFRALLTTEMGEPIIGPMARKLHRGEWILCALIFAFLSTKPFRRRLQNTKFEPRKWSETPTLGLTVTFIVKM